MKRSCSGSSSAATSRVSFTNNGSEPLEVKEGDKIGQGIFLSYFLTDDDISGGKREGGMGSTGD